MFVVASRGSLLVTVSAEPSSLVAPILLPPLGRVSEDARSRGAAPAPGMACPTGRSDGESR
jgi:hypothetical protein